MSGLLLSAPGQGFYNTWAEDNQKTAFVSIRLSLVFYLDSHLRVDYKDTFNLYK